MACASSVYSVVTMFSYQKSDSGIPTTLPNLWASELRVLELVAQGYSNAEIARRCGVTPHSIEMYLNRLYQRLGLSPDILDRKVYNVRIYAALMWWSAEPLSPGVLASGVAATIPE